MCWTVALAQSDHDLPSSHVMRARHFYIRSILYNAIKVCHSYTQSYMYMYNVHVRIQNLNIFLTNVSHPKGDAISVRGQANVYVSMQRNLI